MPVHSITIFTLAHLLLLPLAQLPQQKTPFKLAILYNKSIADAHPSFLLKEAILFLIMTSDHRRRIQWSDKQKNLARCKSVPGLSMVWPVHLGARKESNRKKGNRKKVTILGRKKSNRKIGNSLDGEKGTGKKGTILPRKKVTRKKATGKKVTVWWKKSNRLKSNRKKGIEKKKHDKKGTMWKCG